MRNVTKALTVVSLLAPVGGYSLGIGDIRVRSALNQNLNAEIALVASRGENPSNIKVTLAPPEKFDEAGVPWSYFLSKIRFQPVVKPNGSMVIKVTSREALKEPYLNFLLEVTWPKGNLYREFTVLVDPPAEYQQPAYREQPYQEPAYPLTSNYENYPPQQQNYEPQHRPIRRASRSRRSSNGTYGGQVVTRRNDTLWNVAERTRGSGVSVEQMMMALYDKNPHAFYQQNVNALSAGKRLQVPEKADIQQASRNEALAEFGRHNDAWNNNRTAIPAGGAQPVKGETVDSQLKLEAPTEATVGGNETVLPSSEQTTGTSNTIAATKSPGTKPSATAGTNKESSAVDDALQSKVAALEKQMAMMQDLIALKDKQLAELQNAEQSTAVPPAPLPPVQVTPPAPVVPTPPQPEQGKPTQVTPPPVNPVQPVVPPKPVVKPVIKKAVPLPPPPVAEEPSSLVAWILGGLGAILLPLLGWLWWQKRKISQETDAESMFGNYSSIRGSDSRGTSSLADRKTGTATVSGESSFLNDFKTSDFESFESFNVDHSDIDPVAEADVYLAYGRYQQAEDLIKQSVKDFPDRDDCKLKLLEIYQASSNKDAFTNYAKELVAAGKKEDKDFWGKVVELSKEISDDAELFSASTSPSKLAVFNTEPDTPIENILLIPDVQGVTEKPTEEIKNLGAALFEVSEIDDDVSTSKASDHEQTNQHQENFDDNMDEEPLKSSENDVKLSDDNLVASLGDEMIDFDLPPYPETTTKTEVDKPDSYALDFEPTKSQASNMEDKDDFEAYDFDFNFNVNNEENTPVKAEAPEIDKTWDPNQTIEFAMDDLPSADKLGFDTTDFNFDLDSTQDSLDKPDHESRNFAVSDLTDMDEMETKLDLAKAYIDMGDESSAKEIISQVLDKGSSGQKKTAQALLDDLNLE